MFKPTVARQAVKALSQGTRPAALAATPLHFLRPLSTTVPRAQKDDKAEQEGKYARTDESVVIEYPDDAHMPSQPVVQGRGGMHFKRTLAQFSLENRVTLVTGGARGLGLVMSQGIVASGSNLAIVDLNKEEAQDSAKKLVEQFQKENPGLEELPNVTAHFADVSNPDSVNSALSEIIAKHGKIDHLVTSAGFTENFDAISYPYDRMQKLWGVNVDGTYLFATGVAKHLMERKAPGSIVMIGSMSGSIVNVPQPQAPYNAAKAAVRHLASSFAVEWAGQNIRVNCISPGYMLTAL
jgi:NAD(P)-dependent dehydrogenase (short-subunit alcohol dehydrogenase family)